MPLCVQQLSTSINSEELKIIVNVREFLLNKGRSHGKFNQTVFHTAVGHHIGI